VLREMLKYKFFIHAPPDKVCALRLFLRILYHFFPLETTPFGGYF
jgi:hypothetical protein